MKQVFYCGRRMYALMDAIMRGDNKREQEMDNILRKIYAHERCIDMLRLSEHHINVGYKPKSIEDNVNKSLRNHQLIINELEQGL